MKVGKKPSALPDNFKYDLNRLALFSCPRCKWRRCRNNVVMLNSEANLTRQMEEYDDAFELGVSRSKDTGKHKPRWSKVPQMQYACVCMSMQMMNEDWVKSNNKDCKARGSVNMRVTPTGKYDPTGVPATTAAPLVCFLRSMCSLLRSVLSKRGKW